MESYKLIKENGDELEFDTGSFYISSFDGFGNPNIEYSTENTFFQDGQTVNNFIASPRALSFSLVAQLNDEDRKVRQDWWDLRLEILRFLSPASGTLTFQLTNDNHEVFELNKIYPTNGLTLDGGTYNQDRNDGRIQEQISLTAYDPIWRKTPIESTGDLVPTVDDSLVFPFSFDGSTGMLFGIGGARVNQNITYNGTWRTYPKITINGPYNTCTITNQQNGAYIYLINPITSSETRVIDLTSPIDGFSIVDSSNVSKIHELNLGSSLTDFFFSPDQNNGVTVNLLGGNTTDSRVKVEYYEKYLGI